MKRKLTIIGSSLLMIAIVVGIYGYKEYHRQHKSIAGLDATFNVTSTTLVQDFEADENTANKKYLDKIVVVEGILVSVDMNDRTPGILLNSGSPVAMVSCQLEKGYEQKMRQLKAGKTIKIKGICTGMLMDVILTRCTLID